eukprot:TRINITY_DN67386_c0_g1_i1.p1 TRINITY_DN67386_c0_g1~~TRINITY_DN67386_c0_g1_i1.p1  ORF type:complete len:278 (+),score=67.08 TRINITY_DN67386_c0_g1_i1:85-834(+)
MGLLQSVERGTVGQVLFDQDCHDVRDEEAFIMDNHAVAQYRNVPGPPTSVNLFMEMFVKGQSGGYRLSYDFIVMSPEQRRMVLILCFVASRKGVSEALGHTILQSSLMVVGFMDYRRRLGYGPAPFYSSCVPVFLPSVRIQRIKHVSKVKGSTKATVVSEWSIVADPSLSACRDFLSLSLSEGKSIALPADFAMSYVNCWLDGWNRLHLEFDSLPIFVVDPDPGGVCIVQMERSFGLREAKRSTVPWKC